MAEKQSELDMSNSRNAAAFGSNDGEAGGGTGGPGSPVDYSDTYGISQRGLWLVFSAVDQRKAGVLDVGTFTRVLRDDKGLVPRVCGQTIHKQHALKLFR